jgi:hypothetical protein
MEKKKKKNILLWGLIFLPYLFLIAGVFYYFKKVDEIKNSSFIVINKADMTLSHFNYEGRLLQKAGIATGKSFGDKKEIGDSKTPEGVFRVLTIENASSWTHDFKGDSLGEIKGAYGPYFIRLEVPGQKGIGIHGTHDNLSIGTRASEGCIRMKNEDVTILANSVKTSSVVVIVPGLEDIKYNLVDSIKNAVMLNKATTNHETRVAIVKGKDKKVDKKVSLTKVVIKEKGNKKSSLDRNLPKVKSKKNVSGNEKVKNKK